MQSKTNKLRDQLAIAALEREQIDKQRKELEAQMHKGKINMEKINRGLKGHEISGVLSELDVDDTCPSPIHHKGKNNGNAGRMSRAVSSSVRVDVNGLNISPNKSFHINQGPNRNPSINSNLETNINQNNSKSTGMRQIVIMPTYSRVSDWCYKGPLESFPPTVKGNDVYEFVRWIGRGSFGDVQLVKSVVEKQLYAMKTIFSEHQSEMQKSLNEVVILRTYRHPYIIDIFDAYCTQQPKCLHIVMHYCEGGDLGKLIIAARKNGTTLNEHQIIKWSMQLALALHFLHENHILHRDLKPSNALLTDGGETVKLADFGLTTELVNNVCMSAAEAGTPLYTAPEMIHGERYSYPTDCWSFGVMLHELLSLDPPFYKSDTTELVKSILNDEPPELPGHYSMELRSITKLFLVKNPNHRLGFAAMLSDPFFASKVQSLPATYRPKSLEERIRRAHVKQLQIQTESLQYSSISSSIPISQLLQLIEQDQQEKASIAAAALAEAQALEAAEANEGENGDGNGPLRTRGSMPGMLMRKPSKRYNVSEKNNSSSINSINLSEHLNIEENINKSVNGTIIESMNELKEHPDENHSDNEDTPSNEVHVVETIEENTLNHLINDADPNEFTDYFKSLQMSIEGSEYVPMDGLTEESSTDDGISSNMIARQVSGGRIGLAIAEAQLKDQLLSESTNATEVVL